MDVKLLFLKDYTSLLKTAKTITYDLDYQIISARQMRQVKMRQG